MKKFWNKFAVCVLALVLSLCLFACGGVNDGGDGNEGGGGNGGGGNGGGTTQTQTVTASKAMENMLKVMQGKTSFALNGSVTLTQGAKVTLPATGGVVKTASGYDYSLELAKPALQQSATSKIATVKKGDLQFSTAGDGVWHSAPAEEPDLSSASGLAGLVQLLPEKSVEKKDGTYTFALNYDFGAAITSAFAALNAVKDQNFGDVAAAAIGKEGYGKADLQADIESIFAEGKKLPAVFAAADEMLENIGIPVTVKEIVNSACAQQGMTAEIMYALLISAELEVEPPANGQTVYDYLLSLDVVKNLTGDDLLLFIIGSIGNGTAPNPNEPMPADETEQEGGGGMTQAKPFTGIGTQLLAMLNGTVQQAWDATAESMNELLLMALSLFSDPDMEFVFTVLDGLGIFKQDVWAEFVNADVMLSMENLSKFQFASGGNVLTGALVLNEDFSIKSVELGCKTDVKFNNKSLSKLDIAGTLAFDYTATVTVSEPDGVIAPCFYISEYDLADYVDGDLVLEVYTGKGVTISPEVREAVNEDPDTGEAELVSVGGASYSNGKLTILATAVDDLNGKTLCLTYTTPSNEEGTGYLIGITFTDSTYGIGWEETQQAA